MPNKINFCSVASANLTVPCWALREAWMVLVCEFWIIFSQFLYFYSKPLSASFTVVFFLCLFHFHLVSGGFDEWLWFDVEKLSAKIVVTVYSGIYVNCILFYYYALGTMPHKNILINVSLLVFLSIIKSENFLCWWQCIELLLMENPFIWFDEQQKFPFNHNAIEKFPFKLLVFSLALFIAFVWTEWWSNIRNWPYLFIFIHLGCYQFAYETCTLNELELVRLEKLFFFGFVVVVTVSIEYSSKRANI